MDLNIEHITLALAALKKNSQQGLFGKMGKDKVFLTDDDFNRCDRIFEEAGLPITCFMPIEEFSKNFTKLLIIVGGNEEKCQKIYLICISLLMSFLQKKKYQFSSLRTVVSLKSIY